jgi:hypothetical protein
MTPSFTVRRPSVQSPHQEADFAMVFATAAISFCNGFALNFPHIVCNNKVVLQSKNGGLVDFCGKLVDYTC